MSFSFQFSLKSSSSIDSSLTKIQDFKYLLVVKSEIWVRVWVGFGFGDHVWVWIGFLVCVHVPLFI